MEYYYTEVSNVNESENKLVIKDFEYKHLAKVLRKKSGDNITITDGCRNIYKCKIINIGRDEIICEITGKEFNLYEPDFRLTLCIALLRNPDRFEFAVEKAVELGVFAIQPVITEFTVSKNILSDSRIKRIQKIIIAAMGQSQRCILPEFREAVTFDQLIKKTAGDNNKIVMYESTDDISRIDIEIKNDIDEVNLFTGPEGGFSKNEIDILINNNWKVRSLGSRKYRAETAAIVSIFKLLTFHK